MDSACDACSFLIPFNYSNCICYYSKTGSCDEVAVLCMEVLANMCRYSVSVRAHIKGQVSFTNVERSVVQEFIICYALLEGADDTISSLVAKESY